MKKSVFFAAIVALLLTIWIAILMLNNSLKSPAEQICQNLLTAEYIQSLGNCTISDYTPEYMDAMFPIGSRIEYVQTGMNAFPIYREFEGPCVDSSSTCYSVDYVIRQWPSESYEFVFQDGLLISTTWHN